MSSGRGLVEFPDVEAKLQKPTKQSAFEKQKAEAEAKRQREAAETAAVYEDFVKSFDRDETDGDRPGEFGRTRGVSQDKPLGFGGQMPLGGASKRHFGVPSAVSAPKSGPGSLGSAPNSFGRKRPFDSYQQGSRGDRDGRGLLAFEDRDAEPISISKAFNNSDDEDEGAKSTARAEELAMARPTLRLAHLPPGTSPAFIKSLIPLNLAVENVKILPPMGPVGTERKCTVAIVTLSKETPANEIDTAVSLLQNKYLGYGYHLSLHRHLSSAVSTTTTAAMSASSGSQPFGAKPVAQAPNAAGAPPQVQTGFHRGFAPPTSYGAAGATQVNRSNLLHVPVKPPTDIKMLQLINKVLESLLEHGPEFEALLMTRPEVQREEKWAWLWDSRSEGGVWYRWRLWEIVTGAPSTRNRGKFLPLFDGGHAWKSPDKPLAFEYTTAIDELVSESDYNSSDDEDFEGEGNRENANPTAELEKTFLNPLEKARLTHLLARLPTTLSKMRKGDIARVTTFAILHASRGADEVVDMIVSNVERPYALTGANSYNQKGGKGAGKRRDESDASSPEPEEKGEKGEKDGADTSAASLVGLYVISDILSSSSTSGVRHAWRFRQLVEGVLKDRKIFEKLGLMAEKLGWGRLRAEKWKRSVGMILHQWEGWCVFPAESQELFSNSFENPPGLKPEEPADDSSRKSRWKLVDASTVQDASVASIADESQKPSTARDDANEEDVDVEGEPLEEDDVDGEPMEEEDVEGEPLDEGDLAGEPMEDDDIDGEPMEEDSGESGTEKVHGDAGAEDNNPPSMETAPQGNIEFSGRPAGQARKRMRAVDMFADSGDSDN
jgi:U2-associated protein SR140